MIRLGVIGTGRIARIGQPGKTGLHVSYSSNHPAAGRLKQTIKSRTIGSFDCLHQNQPLFLCV